MRGMFCNYSDAGLQRAVRQGGKAMEITDVRVRKITGEGKLRAVASVTLDNAFAVHDIKIIEGDKGLFIAMPSRRMTDGEYRDIVHPIHSEFRTQLQQVILDSYREMADCTEGQQGEK